MYKILLTGTTKSGKSTLLEMIQKLNLPQVICVPEVARDLLAAHPEFEQDPQLQQILFAEIIRREQAAERSGTKISICDRGAVDILTHLETGYFGDISIEPEWLDWTRSYDQIYVLDKNDIPFTQTSLQDQLDPTRDWSLFRDRLDQTTYKVLTELALPFSVLSGSPEVRLKTVEADLNRLYRSKEGGRWKSKER